MAILTRVKISPQQRYDLEDFFAQQAAHRTDAKLWTKSFLSELNLILGGFNVSGIGLNAATVGMTNAAFIIPQGTVDFSYFISAPAEPDVVISDADLTDGIRNYVEVELTNSDGTPLTKAFWDPEANSGAGSEFNQIVNTITDLGVNFVVSTGGFSGNPDRLPIAIIDTDGSGVIKVIFDRRELFGRLAKPNDLDNDYAWGSKVEPVYSLTMSGTSGTFVSGETITIGGETGTVVTGGTSSITFNAPTGINFSNGDSVTGGTSGATGTVNTVLESFFGVDKSLSNQKKINDALMTEIKKIKGSRFWWEDAATISDLTRDLREDRSAYFRSDAEVTWTGTQLEFTTDIILEIINTKTGVVSQHTIDSSQSPLLMNDLESTWIEIDRDQVTETVTPKRTSINAIPAQSLTNKDLFVLARRVDAVGVKYLHIPFHKQLLSEGQTVRLGSSGSGSSVVKALLHDPLNTTLPSGASYIGDGVTVVNGDEVLFSNLSSNNNRIYKVSGVGTSLVWTAVRAFNGQLSPTDGDTVSIEAGDGFQDQTGKFTGTAWVFNDKVRYFNGADYWEQSNLVTSTLADNTTSNVFTVNYAGSEHMIIDYSLSRGAAVNTGTLHIVTDGTNVSVSGGEAHLGSMGVSFTGDIVGPLLRLRFTTTSTGSAATMKYSIKRWSTAAGGPGGVPNYTGFTGGSGTPGGNNQTIQYNNGGSFAGDDNFKIDTANACVNLNGLEVGVLSSGLTIVDNTAAPATLFSYVAATYRFVTIEYSIVRNGIYRKGSLKIANDGTITADNDGYVETAVTGVTFSTDVNAGNVRVRYTSTNTGFNGTFKYFIMRWS